MAKSIPKQVKNEVLEIVEVFNEEYKTTFQMTFRGQFAYLAKTEKQQINTANTFRQMIAQKLGIQIKQAHAQNATVIQTKLGRLKYNGQMDNWDFAVFKYSREFYDADDWMFPGAMNLNGTIRGALSTGIELYP